MSGDNGGGSPEKDVATEKTEIQLVSERFERYQKDPDSFTENKDLVVAIRRSPKGLMTLINNATRVELELSWARLNHGIHNTITSIEMQDYMRKEAEKKIAIPKGGIMDFARRK